MKQRGLRISQRRKMNNKDIINVEIDTKCSCSPSTSNNDASIQFTRRYLQCQSSMSIRILRLFIETILPHSPMIKVSIFDLNDRLLKDSDRLCSLKHLYSSSNYIPLRFILLNTITSLTHCSCLSPPIEDDLSSSPTIIQQETIEQILSTCSITQQTSSISPCLSSLSSPSPHRSIGICNLLTPSSFLIDCQPDESMMDQITSEFGEICPPLSKSKRYCVSQEFSLDIPLDLSMKKHPLLSQTNWLRTSFH